MKSLKESIFDDVEDIVNDDTVLIEQFLNDNYIIEGTYDINGNVVDVKGHVIVKNEKIESLTNGLFRFGKVSGNFYCTGCPKLKTLEGAPEKVGFDFYCYDCSNLISLKGVPTEVGMSFWCCGCSKLASLEGAPEKVGLDFDCSDCPNLISLKSAPKKVGRKFDCSGCENLQITDRDRKKYKIS